MRSIIACLAAVNAVYAASYSQGAAGIERPTEQKNVIPGRYIVEFEESAVSAAADNDPKDSFYQSLSSSGIEASPKLNISSSIFRGTSFTVFNENVKTKDIEALPEVSKVWRVSMVPKPSPIEHEIGAQATPGWTSHSQTGVLDLHDQGYLGEGAVVAVVDTGIDYNHPSLGGGFGPGFKVEGGTDIVGDNYNGSTFYPDPDPIDRAGHGTHVAGIIAADNDPGFISVAPKANLRIYKVFGDNYDYTGNDALIAAFVQAYEDGADVINASIGGPSGWTEDPWAVVASRLVNEGIFITISAGNEGADGPWYASSGSTGVDVIAVASIDTENFVGYPADVSYSNGTTEVTYLPTVLVPYNITGTLPVYPVSLNTTNTADACDALPDDTPDLSGFLVLIRRGTCTFAIKEANAVAKGAEYIWFYNIPDLPIVYPGIDDPVSKGVAMITREAGEAIVNDIISGYNVTATFEGSNSSTVQLSNEQTGGKISTFSTWGPSNEVLIKPEIAAPGGYIYSTFPLAFGGHAVLSGTSMASPYIAGIAALYIAAAGGREALGGEGIKALKDKIIQSGTLLNFNDGSDTYSELTTVAQQGGGYVNAAKVVTYTTEVSPGKIELNDTAYFNGEVTIEVTNAGDEAVVYTLSNEPVATVNTFEEGYYDPQIFPPTFVNGTAEVSASSYTLSLSAGESGSFPVSFTAPNIASDLYPIYSGALIITGSNGEVKSVPYLGVVGAVHDIDIWAIEDGEPWIIDDNTGELIEGSANFTLVDYDRPAAIFFNHFGTVELRWDVYTPDYDESAWEYPPEVGVNGFVGSVLDAYEQGAFPWTYIPRTDPLGAYYYYAAFNGLLSNGSYVAAGEYVFDLRVLRVFGDPSKAADWQAVTTPTYGFAASGNGTNSTVAASKDAKSRMRRWVRP